ncbi:LacI family DNA-binding transcriptional regulator [Pedobacter cryophilus]|uniref:LacI family DNA-binding transcriptional regulator n=1 Tax=Pedobacter cryophilus TaxID=2571271 RepID=A0A4U1C0X3_9SPHI|nr:substrate-binding domain-containing protein [Pedobacter cryophilus]TKB99192.1 LacI family DNA-binding transcriptional regulator [Pedobacter cryophilus]
MKKNIETELVGVKEIARRAEVAIATVDRVLNNRKGVSAKTKEKILGIIKELDYKPNIMARRLASNKTLKFAVLIPKVSEETDYWKAPLEGVKNAASEIKDYGIIVDIYFFDQNNKLTFSTEAVKILEKDYQGVILAPMFEEESISFIQKCYIKNIPYVFINSDIDEQNSLCYIGPNLYQSGYLAGHLISYLISEKQKILLVNISKEIDPHHHLLRKEEGFRAYFNVNHKENDLIKIDIKETDYLSVKQKIAEVLTQTSIDIIFVTNSRVSSVARYLEETGQSHIKLIGYDFLEENINYLKKNVIDFLICQKPQEQGYKGIMALYNFLVNSSAVDKQNYMPIDIITKENYKFYKN